MPRKLHFDDKQFFSDCEEKAIDGVLDYDGFPAVEYKYFSRLSRLGYLNRHKGWSKELCEQKQQELLQDYSRERGQRDFFLDIARQIQQNIRRGEELMWQINKAGTDSEKLMLALKCIGAMTDDEGFAKRNGGKKID